MNKLTSRQTQILELIQEQIDESGSPPTRAEIAKKMGFKSPNAAEDHLRALHKKGIIELVPGTSRGIRLLQQPSGEIPVIGRVAAGVPILAEENITRSYQVDKHLFRHKPDYLLKVCGDSMINAGIYDDDLLAVKSTSSASNGQIAVVRIDDEVTVKRFYHENRRIRLKPENPEYSDIIINQRQNVAIEGIAIGIIRHLTS